VKDPTLYLLTGPTASGKTAAAITWALAHQAEIVSCDALLVYRGMDIGTAKPSAHEQTLVPHHLIDLVPANQPYNVVRYHQAAQAAIRCIHQRGKRVLIVGGSGFYLKSFLAPIADEVSIPPAICQQVHQAYQDGGLPRLVAWLHELHGSAGLPAFLDIHNPRRVVRALQRCLATGQTLQALQAAFRALPCPFQEYPKKLFVLAPPADVLRQRIHERTWAMLHAGLVDEVRGLLAKGLLSNPSAAGSVGYRQVIAWLQGAQPSACGGAACGATDGTTASRASGHVASHTPSHTPSHTLSLQDLHAQIVRSTLQLVRKQRTWLAHQLCGPCTASLTQLQAASPALPPP
jgi:tRNA dimethylallyltransferase